MRPAFNRAHGKPSRRQGRAPFKHPPPILCGLRLAPGCAWHGSGRLPSYQLVMTVPLSGGFCAFLAGRTGPSILGLDVSDRNADATV